MQQDYMTVYEAAQVLGLHRATVLRRLENGTMRGERIHRRLWLIPRDEVERWRGRGRLPAGRPRKAAKEN